jgi:hypothetical protein
MKFRNQMILNCEQGTICKPSSDAQNRDHSWPRPTRLQHTIHGQHPTAGAGVNRTLSMTVGCVRGPLSQAVGFLRGGLFTAFCFGSYCGESSHLLALFEASWKACWMDGFGPTFR